MFYKLFIAIGDIRKYFVARCLIMLPKVVLQLVSGYFVGCIASVIIEETPGKLPFLLSISLSIALGAAAVTCGVKMLKTIVTDGAASRLRTRTMDALYHCDVQALGRQRTGDLLTRMQNNVEVTAQAFGDLWPEILGHLLEVVIIGGYLFSINSGLTLLLLAFYPFIIWVQARITQPLEDKQAKMMQAQGELGSLQQSMLVQRENARIYGIESFMYRKYRSKLRKSRNAFLSFVRSYSLQLPLGSIMGIIPQLLLLGGGGWLVSRNRISLPVLLSYIVLAEPFFAFLVNMFSSFQSMRSAFAGARRLLEIWELPEERAGGAEFEFDAGEPLVCIKNAFFRYAAKPVNEKISEDDAEEQRQFELCDINLTIGVGEKVALVGPSGAGKSTLLKLLEGMYSPVTGSIALGGHDYSDWSLDALRTHIVFVPQDPVVFPGNILDNITLSSEAGISPEAAMRAAELAAVADLARDNRSIGQGARELSHGQRQRIGLARAFARKAQLVLLDEPFSAIEGDTAAVLQDRVLVCEAAVVQITHRLTDMERFDRICVMHEGRIADMGTHTELLAKSELYKKLIFAGEVE